MAGFGGNTGQGEQRWVRLLGCPGPLPLHSAICCNRSFAGLWEDGWDNLSGWRVERTDSRTPAKPARGGDAQEGEGIGRAGAVWVSTAGQTPSVRDCNGTRQLLSHRPHALLLIFTAVRWHHHSLHFGTGKTLSKQRQCPRIMANPACPSTARCPATKAQSWAQVKSHLQ